MVELETFADGFFLAENSYQNWIYNTEGNEKPIKSLGFNLKRFHYCMTIWLKNWKTIDWLFMV